MLRQPETHVDFVCFSKYFYLFTYFYVMCDNFIIEMVFLDFIYSHNFHRLKMCFLQRTLQYQEHNSPERNLPNTKEAGGQKFDY